MKLFSAQTFYSQKGFTLIELLVVIGILGILAASLVATIDPFEQLKKANDTKVQNGTVEFQTSNVRYYTGQSTFPWENSAALSTCYTHSSLTTGSDSTKDVASPILLSTITPCIDELIAKGELKASFKDVTGVLDKVYLREVAGTLQVCYLPTSKSGRADKAAKYIPAPTSGTPTSFTAEASGGTTCIANGGTQQCYWCTQ